MFQSNFPRPQRLAAVPAVHTPVLALAELAEAMDLSSLGLLFAKVSGFVMSLGSIVLFSPIIFSMVRNRTGEGISFATFWLQLFGFSAIFLYNFSKSFPIAAYGENISLALQSLVILLLASYYRKCMDVKFFAALAVYFSWMAVCLAGVLPPGAMSVMQVVATVVITGAIIPQILLNFRRQDSGEWSIFTAAASTGGNALRVFTTIQLTQDPLLLTGYVLGLLVNATLLGQIVYYKHIRKPSTVNH